MPTPIFHACNTFNYYANLGEAWAFYGDLLGFETVIDHPSAKVLRLCAGSFLTLVDARLAPHLADAPKSVTLALVTEQVEAWYAYLTGAEVPMLRPLKKAAGKAHDGFVALDPEGYFLEVERFNPHPENERLLPRLAQHAPIFPNQGARPPALGVQATVRWLYYEDVAAAMPFYETLLGQPMIVDQGWAKVYPVAANGYIGLVESAQGLHRASPTKQVTVSLLTAPGADLSAPLPGLDGQSLSTQAVGLTDPGAYTLHLGSLEELAEPHAFDQLLHSIGKIQ